MLKTAILAATLAAFTLPAAADTTQQDKMKTCNAEASSKSLKGDERKKFMSTCLSAGGTKAAHASGGTTQQQKMTDCNAEASSKSLKGDERKQFMSACLSK